jgi:DNA-binding transcriptional ArsR family regulator
MSIPSPKHALYEQFAAVAKALGHPQRLELIEHLAQGPRSVDALAVKLGLPIANVSQHLQSLRRAGLVTAERAGKFVNYRIADEGVHTAFAAVRAVAERHVAEVDRIVRGYFRERDAMEPVTREELAERMRDGLVTVLDGHPATLAWLGSATGRRVNPLGVDRFGQSGDIPDLYRIHRIDADAILDRVALACTERARRALA